MNSSQELIERGGGEKPIISWTDTLVVAAFAVATTAGALTSEYWAKDAVQAVASALQG